LVIDPALSDLRRIYPQDCYSWWDEDYQQLEADRQHLQYWEGWSGARSAWDHYPMEKRIRRTYTEGFVRNSSPCAMIVYGDPAHLNKNEDHLIKKFRKNGFPIYYLNVAC
jgi:hypothetical protein